MRRRTAARRAAACILMAVLPMSSVTACGRKKPIPGPNVQGMNLQDAETALKAANIAYTEHAKDATFGIIIKTNFVVCKEVRLSDHEVRLEAAKNGCS